MVTHILNKKISSSACKLRMTSCLKISSQEPKVTLLYFAGLNKSLGLSNELFVLGDSLVLTVLGQVSFMPILVLAARLCPEVSN